MANSFNVQGQVTLSTTRAEKDLSRFINKAEKRKVKLALDDRAFTQPLGRITGAADEFNKSLAASNARVIAFAASAGLMYAVQRALTEVAKSAIEVEKSLADVNVILGASASNLQKFGNELFRIAGQTGQAFGTVSEAATELARQGLSLEETLKRTRDAMILTRLSGMDAASSVNALTAAMNTFKNTALDTTKIVNKLANVDAAFAVSTTDLAEALKRVGSSALDAGVNFDQLLGMVTAVQQTTARGGPVIGNALKSIFTRIQRTETLDQLERLGFTVRSLDGSTRPAISILSELAKKIDTLTAAQKASTTELIGGVFQINVVKAALADLGSEYSIYNNALQTSIDSTNQAIQRNDELNKTLAALVNKTFANVKKAAADIGKLTIAPALGGVLEKANDILENFSVSKPESAGEKIAAGILDGMGKFIKGPGLVIGLAIIGRLLQNFGKFASDSFKEFFNLNEAAKKRVELEKFVNAELMKNEDLTQAILKGELSVADAEKVILANLKNRVVEQERILKIVQQTSGLLKQSGVQVVGQDIGGTTAYSVKPPKTKSGGHIPNYANGNVQDLVREELKGASYATGGTKAVIDTLPGLGLHVRNTSESVKNSPIGPFINPPMNSPEGYRHRSEAIKRTGMDPYALSGGYVPNFAKAIRKNSKTKIADLGRIGLGTGMLLPEFSNTRKTGQVFQENVSKVGLGKKRLAKFREKFPNATSIRASGFSVAGLHSQSNQGMNNLIDKAMKNAFPTIGAGMLGGKKIKTPSNMSFSKYFDKNAWPQTRGRIFEGALNFVQNATKDLSGESGRGTWDFPNIKNQLAGLFKVPINSKQDAKNKDGADARASMINKAIVDKAMFSAGFIPNFATANLMGIKSGFEQQIQSVAAGDIEINKTQGLAARIQSSPLSAPEKTELKNKLKRAKDAQRARKSPKGVTIDGNNLGSMLVPKLGNSGGVGVAKPEASDNEFLRRYLSRHYEAKTGVDFNSLSEAQQNKVMGGTKATFPVLAPIKGGKRNIVDEVRNAMENETQAFAASMIEKGGDLGLIQKNLGTHESSISSAAGAVFESGVKTAFDLDVGKTNDRFDAVTSPGLKQAFAINTPFGEFKINDDSALRQNMASKVLKQKLDAGVAFGGHIPNFADPNRMREAIQGGVPYSQTYRSFVDTPKYTGPVIGNTRDEPTQQALKRAVMMHNDPKNAGRFNAGWIPNFAEESLVSKEPAGSKDFQKAADQAKVAFKDVAEVIDVKFIKELEEAAEELRQLEQASEQAKKAVEEEEKRPRTGQERKDQKRVQNFEQKMARSERAQASAEERITQRKKQFTKGEAEKLGSLDEEGERKMAASRARRQINKDRKAAGLGNITAGMKSKSKIEIKRLEAQIEAETSKQLTKVRSANKEIAAKQKTIANQVTIQKKLNGSMNRQEESNRKIADLKEKQRKAEAQRLAALRKSSGKFGGAAGMDAARSSTMGIGSTPLGFGSFFGMGAGSKDLKLLDRAAKGQANIPGMTAAQAGARAGEMREARSAKLSSAGMTAAFVAPMLTSTLAQTGAISQEASGVVGGAAMGAGMGTMFGAPGIAIGAALGGGMALPKFIDSLSDESKQFAKTAEMAAEKLTKFNSSTQDYIKNLTNFNEAILDTSGKFSPDDLLERQDALQASLMQVPDEFLGKMSAAQGNVKEIQKIFAEIQKDLQMQAQQAKAAAELTKLFEDETGFTDIGDEIFEGADADLKEKQFFNSIKSAIDLSKLTGKEGEQNAQALIAASRKLGTSNAEFNSVLEDLGVGPEVIRALNRAYEENKENLTLLGDDFIELAKKQQTTSTALQGLTRDQINYANQVAETEKVQKQMNAVMVESQQLVTELTRTLANRFKFVNDLAAARTQNRRTLDLGLARGQTRVNAPFIDETTKQSQDAQLKTLELQSKQLTAMENLQKGIRSGLVKDLGDQFDKLSNSVEKTGSLQSDAQQSVNETLQKQIDQRQEVGQILNQVVSFANTGGVTNQQIGDKIEELVNNSKLNTQAQLQITNKVRETLEKSEQDIALLVEKNDLETKLLRVNNEFQRQIVENTKALSTLGSVGDFLSGQNEGLEKISEVFKQRNRVDRPNQGLRGSAFMQQGQIAAGRSDLQVLDLLRNFAKLDPDSFPDALREGAVQGLAASQNEMISAIKAGLQRGGELDAKTAQALENLASRSFAIAETKVQNLLKDKDPNQGMIDEIKILQSKVLTQFQASESFQKALNITFNPKSAYITTPLEKIAAILKDQEKIDENIKEKNELESIREELRTLRGLPEENFKDLKSELMRFSKSIPEEMRKGLKILNPEDIANVQADPQGMKTLQDQFRLMNQTLLKPQSMLNRNNRQPMAKMFDEASTSFARRRVSTLIGEAGSRDAITRQALLQSLKFGILPGVQNENIRNAYGTLYNKDVMNRGVLPDEAVRFATDVDNFENILTLASNSINFDDAIQRVTSKLEDIFPNADEITKGELQDEAKRLVTLLTLSMKQIERDEAAGKGITPEVFGSQFGRVIADTTDIQKKLTQSSRDVRNVFDKIRALEQKEIAQKQKLATATDQLINSMSQASLSLLSGQYQKTKESETADLRNILGKSRTAKGTNMIPGLVAQARGGANLQQIEQTIRRSNRGVPQEQRLTDAQIQDAAIKAKRLADTEDLLAKSTAKLDSLRKLQIAKAKAALAATAATANAATPARKKVTPTNRPQDLSNKDFMDLEAMGTPEAFAEMDRRFKAAQAITQATADKRKIMGDKRFERFFSERKVKVGGVDATDTDIKTIKDDPFNLAEDARKFFGQSLDPKTFADQFGLLGKGVGRAGKVAEAVNKDIQKANEDFADGIITRAQRDAKAATEALRAAQNRFAAGEIDNAQLAQAIQAQIEKEGATGLKTEELFIELLTTTGGINKKGLDNLRKSLSLGLAKSVAPKQIQELDGKIKEITNELASKGLTTLQVETLSKALADYSVAETNFADGLATRAELISKSENAFNAALATNNPEEIAKARQKLIDDLAKGETGADFTKRSMDLSRSVFTGRGGPRLDAFDKQIQEQLLRTDQLVNAGMLREDQKQNFNQAAAKIKSLQEAGVKDTKESLAAFEAYFQATQGTKLADVGLTRLTKAQDDYFKSQNSLTDLLTESFKNADVATRGRFTDFQKRIQDQISVLEGRNVTVTQEDRQAIIAQDRDKQDTDRLFKEGRLTGAQLKARRDQQLQKARALGDDTADEFMSSLAARFTAGDNDLEFAMQDMALSLIDSFEDNLNNAMFNAVTGAKEVEEAFKDMADAMLNEMTRMAIEAGTRRLMTSIGTADMLGIPQQERKDGGLIKKFNRGGMVTGGSGFKDDVPAMLQAGEFVIKKKSVDKFGSGLFQAMNSYSKGGMVSHEGLVDMGILHLNPHYKERGPDPQAGLSSQGFTGGRGAGFTLRNAFVYDENLSPSSGRLEVDSRLSRRALTDSSNPRNQIRMNKEKGLQDFLMQRQQDMDQYQEEYQTYLDRKKATWMQAGITAATFIGLNANDFAGGAGFKNFRQLFKKNAMGGHNVDNVPALLMDGEYVMSRDAVQKYGISTFNKLNSGQIPRFANGGSVGDPQPINDQSGASQGLTNNVTINVNVDNNGSVSSSVKGPEAVESTAGSQREQSKELARTIESAVIKVLVDQKKQGGMLS